MKNIIYIIYIIQYLRACLIGVIYYLKQVMETWCESKSKWHMTDVFSWGSKNPRRHVVRQSFIYVSYIRGTEGYMIGQLDAYAGQ